MNKRLFNQQNLTRRLRLLPVLCAMLLMPFSVWAEDYPIVVAGVQVTDANAGNVLGDGETATVVFTPANNAVSPATPATLTLNGATLNGSIVLQSGLDDLTIHLLGDNKIQGADYQNPLANGIKRENGATTGTLTFTTASGASGTLFFPYVTTPIEGFENIVYNNGLEWGCDSYIEDNKVCTNFYEGVGTNVVLASASWQDCITKTQTTLSLGNGATIEFREDNSLGRVLTLSGFTDYISSIWWYSHSDVKFEISGTNSFIFDEGSPRLIGNDQSNVSFIATGTSAATLRFWHEGTGANDFDLSEPFISGFKNSANPGLEERLYIVDVVDTRRGSNSNYTDFMEHYITTEAYDLKVSGVRVHNLDGVFKGHKDHILGEKENDVFNTSVTFAPASTTLTLNKADFTHSENENAIISSLSTPLYVHLLGENTINSLSYLPFEGATGEDADLVFTTTNDSDPGSLTLISTHADFGKTTFYTGFNEVQYPENSGSLGAKEESGNVIITQIQSYGLSIAGIPVTSENAGGITGDGITGTVTYNATQNALTLNGASIIPEGEAYGIKYTGTADLTISLKGSNTVKGGGACNAILYDDDDDLDLIFSKGDTEPCSLLLEAEGTQAIDGFENISHDGLYMLDEVIQGADQNTIYRTTITSTLLSGGTGTSNDPFLIETKEDLVAFANYVNDGVITTEYVKLNKNINCSELTGFEPIGTSDYPFTGTFTNSDNYTISNLNCTTAGPDGYVGLFSIIGFDSTPAVAGNVSGLILENCSFSGGTVGGAIAGYLSCGTISHCLVTNCSVTTNSGVAPTSAGIAGESFGTISNCTVSGSTIIASTTAYNASTTAGGIVGTNGGTISNCEVTGTSEHSTLIKSSYNDASSDASRNAGGIVGNCIDDNGYTITVSGNSVNGVTTVDCEDTGNAAQAGAIIGHCPDNTNITLMNNFYEYTVETIIKNNNVTDERTGYMQRGSGDFTYDQSTETNVYTDITASNGAVMYTKPLTVEVPSQCDSYTPLSSNGVLALAPGQAVDIYLNPADGMIISAASLVYTPEGGVEQTENLTNIGDPGQYRYSFEMPNAETTLNTTTVQTYALWIGDTQVTSANADDVLGNDSGVSFTVSGGQVAAPTYTLTLNDAALTVPVKVGLSNLTIDIHGTNTITTNTTCIQNVAEKVTPSLTFKSTSDVVGSLIMTDTGREGISEIGEGNITVSNELAVLLTVYGNEDYTSRLYYITDGSTTVAKIVPGYGVKVNDMQVYAGNAANVLGDDDNVTVSFDEETATLTLNGASGISTIRTSLSTLNIDLVGSNSLYRSSDGSIFENASGENVTINLKSTSATGALTIEAPKVNGATIIGENVTLTPVAPVVLLSSDVEDNKGTMMYGVNYGLTVDGVPVTIANAADVKNDGGTVKFDGRSRLVLNNASLARIILGTTNTLPESELEIYLVGSSTIANDAGYAVKSENAEAAVKLKFLTGGDAPGMLTYTNGGAASENVFPGFNVIYNDNLALTPGTNVTTVKVPLNLIVDYIGVPVTITYDEGTYNVELDNDIINKVLYTLHDTQTEGAADDGFDNGDIILNSVMTDAQVEATDDLIPGSEEYAAAFKGLTFIVPAGEGEIVFKDVITAGGFAFHVRIGKQTPVALVNNTGTPIDVTVPFACTTASYVKVYLVTTGAPAPAFAQAVGGHRIGPKSSVSGGLGGLSVSSSMISSAPDAGASYVMMSAGDYAAVAGSRGIRVNNADVTDLPDGAFSSMSISPVSRRALDANMKTYIDASNTKITGKSFSRTEGAFKDVPEETLIYLPAGNTAVGKNFIIGGICENMELKGDRENPFEAAADFTAAMATFDREFAAGKVDDEQKCYTIFLPYALKIAEVGGELWEYSSYDSDKETVNMTQVVANSDNKGWTTPNKVYFFKPSETGTLNPVLSTQVKKFEGTVAEPDNESEAEGMHGVYEYFKWTTKPSNVYCYSASDKDGIEAGEFAKVGADTYINPFRAYLRLNTSSAPEFLSITWGDGTTSIVPLDKEQVHQDADGWYTITGFRLPGKPTEKGIYIHNQKKTVVK